MASHGAPARWVIMTSNLLGHACPHPLLIDRYRVHTQAIEQLHQTIKVWLFTGATGGYVWGEPRSGKTTALEYVAGALRTRAGKPVTAFTFNAKTFTRVTDNKLWAAILSAAGHGMAHVGNAIDKYQRLVSFLAEHAQTNEAQQVVLIIDEAQKWQRLEFEMMVDLHNDLRGRGVQLCTILVGTRELRERAQQLDKHFNGHIRGRFFLRMAEYRGLQNTREIAFALRQYDDVLRWPDDAGVPFTQYLLPDDYQNGFRLEAYAGLLWHVFTEMREQHGYADWPMAYFVVLVQVLLLDYLPQYGSDSCDESMVASALENTGLCSLP